MAWQSFFKLSGHLFLNLYHLAALCVSTELSVFYITFDLIDLFGLMHNRGQSMTGLCFMLTPLKHKALIDLQIK